MYFYDFEHVYTGTEAWKDTTGMYVGKNNNQWEHFELSGITKIKFIIPKSPLLGGDGRGGLVNLNVYDILGNEIVTLINGEKPAGT